MKTYKVILANSNNIKNTGDSFIVQAESKLETLSKVSNLDDVSLINYRNIEIKETNTNIIT